MAENGACIQHPQPPPRERILCTGLMSIAVIKDISGCSSLSAHQPVRGFDSFERRNQIDICLRNTGDYYEDVPDNNGRLKEQFLARHPHLKEFVEDEDIAFILVTVREYIIAGLQDSQRVVIS